MHFVDGVFLPDFGLGTGIALWGFRACASGHSRCWAITNGYEKIFGTRGPEALADVLQLARIFGFEGRRKISVATPGCGRLTADELSMAAMFAAAQLGEEEERDSHVTWLFGRRPAAHVGKVVDRIAEIFLDYDLHMGKPDVTVTFCKGLHEGHARDLMVLDGGRA